jgi:pantoate--beta-alanine ligase
MKIFISKNKLIKFIKHEKSLGFVPTMGSIHLGHISLFKRSISQCKTTVVSIFINKPQFNKKIDYQKYPRTLNRDISILRKLKVDFLYIPKSKEIYPKGSNKKIKISSLGKELCGKFRPGHFEAVVDVIERFIKIIKPNKIFLGEKDMQQLKIIDHFVKNSYKNIKVVPCKTIRERSGIAYSSRNFLLSPKEKKIASNLYKLIINNKKKLIKKKISLKKFKKKISDVGVNKIDYIKLININKFSKAYSKNKKYKIFVAYYLGGIRLIDKF